MQQGEHTPHPARQTHNRETCSIPRAQEGPDSQRAQGSPKRSQSPVVTWVKPSETPRALGQPARAPRAPPDMASRSAGPHAGGCMVGNTWLGGGSGSRHSAPNSGSISRPRFFLQVAFLFVFPKISTSVLDAHRRAHPFCLEKKNLPLTRTPEARRCEAGVAWRPLLLPVGSARPGWGCSRRGGRSGD